MAGAFSLFLGLLGLGAAGAVSAGQNAKIKKADYQYGEEHGLHGTSEVLQMRERVRKEWWSICGKTYNACERPAYLINCLEFQASFSLAFYFISVFRYT
jgi:hypothetical protein